MEEIKLLDDIELALKEFGPVKCKKFAGAVTVEVLRCFLARRGIPVSARDVYIRGVPIEMDVVVPTKEAAPLYGLLYKPEEVVVVLEVKKRGSFGESTVNNIKTNFQRIRGLNAGIHCAYVTLEEQRGFKHAPTQDKVGFPCFTLFWYQGSGKSFRRDPSDDWEKLVRFLAAANAAPLED